MAADNTSLMIALLRRLKVEMNGAVTDAMVQGGINYGLNYGVSVPTIKDIAGEYGKNHSLALFLYEQDVRELKLAAFFIDDPECVTLEQMKEWSREFTNSELVEQGAMRLFSKSPVACEMALEWIGCDNEMLRYAGLLTGAGFIADIVKAGNHTENLAADISLLTDKTICMLYNKTVDQRIAAGVISLLRQAAKYSAGMKSRIKTESEKLSLSNQVLMKHIGAELAWLIEY